MASAPLSENPLNLTARARGPTSTGSPPTRHIVLFASSPTSSELYQLFGCSSLNVSPREGRSIAVSQVRSKHVVGVQPHICRIVRVLDQPHHKVSLFV